MKTFKSSVTLLIIGILGIMSFAPKPMQFWLEIGLFASWGIFQLIRLKLWSSRRAKKVANSSGKFAGTQQADPKAKKIKTKKEKKSKFRASEPDGEPDVILALKRHVNCRISEKLKSAYPNATWEWCGNFPAEAMITSGTARIKTENTGEYNYADVESNEFGSIKFAMIKLVNFDKVKPGNATPPPAPVDVSVWYSLVGQKIIKDIVTDLNTHGHSSLFIKENGDIITVNGTAETKHDTLANFPQKSIWVDVIQVFTGDGLTAVADNDRLTVSW